MVGVDDMGDVLVCVAWVGWVVCLYGWHASMLRACYCYQRRIQGRCAPPPLPYFLQPLVVVFFNHFEELQTVLFEVELIINNASLTHVYPNYILLTQHQL